jgi:hypothetical protein
MILNDFPLIELTEEALKENAVSLLGVEYSEEKEKELIRVFVENELILADCRLSANYQFAEGILLKFNDVLNFHGVEPLQDSNIPALEDHNILYCNSGDSYTQTIIWFDGSYFIGDWGSLLEYLENKFNREEEVHDYYNNDNEELEDDEEIEELE